MNGPGVFVLAEISSNHRGELKAAMDLIRAAKAAGADGVKFQAFTLEEILALRGDGPAPAPWDTYTRRELYTLGQTPLDWFPLLFETAREAGLVPISTVMGPESLAVLEGVRCPAYKIASYEATDPTLRRLLERTGKPVILSSNLAHSPGHPAHWRTLYCPPGYPAPVLNLRHLRNGYDGLSCHNLDPDVPVVAVGAGARMLEYHLKLDDGVPVLDEAFSHTPGSFAAMVRSVRAAEQILG